MRNRHIALALVLAPLLSLLAWWATGPLLGQQPAPAQAGQSYPLVAKSNCRWSSGECHLENADIQLQLTFLQAPRPVLIVVSSVPVDAVLVSVGVDANVRPQSLQSATGAGPSQEWRLPLAALPSSPAHIRLAVRAKGSSWYGETGLAFMPRN